MGALRLVLGDQLSRNISSLNDLDRENDTVLMVEVAEEGRYVPHHKKKIAYILSAMRHHADALKADGIAVRYVCLDDPRNTQSFSGEVSRAIDEVRPDRLIVTEPGEWRVLEMMRDWEAELPLPVEIREDDRFVCSHAEFANWAEGRKQLRMEFFYREMRRKTGLLMEDGQPVGGAWNYDADNRKALPNDVALPQRLSFTPDETTSRVKELVQSRFGDHFGDLAPFSFAVTRHNALKALDHFVTDCLPWFGDYQDAMKQGEPFLFHGLIGAYLNSGLLDPIECCERAEAAWHEGDAPLNAVEGFIRQIIGWREYVRGIYWLKMPDYAETNALNAHRPLPDFYWTGETEMNCIRQCVEDTRRNAYAHHIQRLMVTGNFALLAGIAPAEIEEWYLSVYADAYDWVELPNTHGMVMFADGGLLASKPYAASGAYIDRMSDYCGSCSYDVKQKTGKNACPFNVLYWNFVAENREVLKSNQRMRMIYASLEKMNQERVKQIQVEARAFLDEVTAAS
ncbi:MAG: cryptochrome/photolyase family protein [Pseudomonadota bacterium]